MPTCSQLATSRVARCDQYLTQLFSQVLVAGVCICLLLQTCTAGLQNGQKRRPVVRGVAGICAFQGTCCHVTAPQEDLHTPNAAVTRLPHTKYNSNRVLMAFVLCTVVELESNMMQQGIGQQHFGTWQHGQDGLPQQYAPQRW